MSDKPIVCLMGPTASGKTGLAIKLCEEFPFEIVSVDSAMVYRGMDIGTAKPTAAELKRAPHRLINLCEPEEKYSAGQFCQDAENAIKEIQASQRIPLFVGGTMLYFNLFQRGFSKFPSHNQEIRDSITAHAEKLGWEEMHNRLRLVDPKAANQIHPNDPQRIQRALELYEMTGQTMSDLQVQQVWQAHPYKFINLILNPSDRAILHKRIERRVDAMLDQGLVEEVNKLYQRKNLNSNLPAMRMLNYRQVWAYLEGEYDQETMRERCIFATRQFAKRQLTWLRRWKDAQWFDSEVPDLAQQVAMYLNKKI